MFFLRSLSSLTPDLVRLSILYIWIVVWYVLLCGYFDDASLHVSSEDCFFYSFRSLLPSPLAFFCYCLCCCCVDVNRVYLNLYAYILSNDITQIAIGAWNIFSFSHCGHQNNDREESENKIKNTSWRSTKGRIVSLEEIMQLKQWQQKRATRQIQNANTTIVRNKKNGIKFIKVNFPLAKYRRNKCDDRGITFTFMFCAA